MRVMTLVKSADGAGPPPEALMELHHEHWPGWEGETEIRRIFP